LGKLRPGTTILSPGIRLKPCGSGHGVKRGDGALLRYSIKTIRRE